MGDSISHRDLADLAAALYGLPGAPPVEWLYRSNVDANVHMGIIRVGKFLVFVFRGSFSFWDWVHDLDARHVVPNGRPVFGDVHEGMYGGTVEAWDIARQFVRVGDVLIFAGHSLGASRANFLAGHAKACGLRPRLVLCWGEPRHGFKQFADFMSDVPIVTYRNVVNHVWDGVTELPPPVGYVHRARFSDVSSGEIPLLDVDPFGRHHFRFYWPGTPLGASIAE